MSFRLRLEINSQVRKRFRVEDIRAIVKETLRRYEYDGNVLVYIGWINRGRVPQYHVNSTHIFKMWFVKSVTPEAIVRLMLRFVARARRIDVEDMICETAWAREYPLRSPEPKAKPTSLDKAMKKLSKAQKSLAEATLGLQRLETASGATAIAERGNLRSQVAQLRRQESYYQRRIAKMTADTEESQSLLERIQDKARAAEAHQKPVGNS